ncbi:beta-lactamase family protein [Ancylobacter sp. MQZ15Z-1]|uniref:Beta-lactamase family protein n=1 Tax=Ancylobacter mangrovi TaxID=2972472 RepID=A0A9X2PJL1_9HYPH|nr:serine hydrolase domain-containing protein [Ancylobacter mangrovi]MCS0496382.1 beta-lactamase family protein [Ancylobacter mangrovi]
MASLRRAASMAAREEEGRMAGWSAWSGRGAPARLPTVIAILALVLSIAMSGAPARSAPLPCGAPPPAGEGWEVAAPASVGLDPALLCTIGARLESPDRPNVHALLVIRHGRLVYEAYASGRDERWGEDIGLVDHDAGRLHDLRSVTKSVVSLLFGVARERGMFGRLDAPIIDFFPAETGNAAPEARAVTLRDLLTMTPGFTWNEGGPWWSPANDERLMHEAADPYAYVLSRPMGAPPGTRWNIAAAPRRCSVALWSGRAARGWRTSRAKRCSSRWASTRSNGWR